ncbi:MAG: DUF3157 family protein [Shewanella algae]|uniref:Protein of uncharacterized function (DUF3157) n=1 Tax=Shewanella algae TaxID=38313 RepID=A0A379ZRB4_9GAMM|nr:DUF3157 family protein [Shewanella algae]EKT4488816.1 DUF3157 family protein [Shewanella algae]MBO2546318.1 DUF3157 family protein [Shewanella algae]MBO2567511.1 DUF3157 family protein [Shewanella algae]MBO2605848.1 DUF3157 family protein [Shewanella algae]MBO2639510.1 DUF3157 family protein [Shewanella algae]
MSKQNLFKPSFAVSALALILSSNFAIAEPAQVAEVTLENGARVILKDDFTWEYVLTEAVISAAEPETTTEEVVAEMPNSAAHTTAATAAAVEMAAKPEPSKTAVVEQLTQSAMTTPGLLGKTAREGISVSLQQVQWKGDKLGLTFELDSNSSEDMVEVLISASFYNDQGRKMKEEELQVWRAIKRMPETYLRKGQQRQSSVIWVEGVDKNQWQKQLLNLKITELDTW